MAISIPGAVLTLSHDRLTLDLIARSASIDGRRLLLSPREFGLLALLISLSPAAVDRATLLARVFGCRFDPGTNLVEVHLSRLRAKLRREGGPAIVCQRGEGYRLG